MLGLHPRRLSAALSAFVTFIAFSTAAAPAGTDVTLDGVSAASPIEIRGDALPVGNGAGARTVDAGVSFENHAAASATSVDFTWVFLDANGATVGEEHTAMRGQFRPSQSASAQVQFPGYTTGSVVYVADSDTNTYVPLEHISVVVDDATFADGSVWEGKARQTFAPPPEGFSDASAAAVHIRVLRIATTRDETPYDRVDTRLSFASDNKKRIDAIQFAYTFYDQYGNVIFQGTSIARGVYPRGAISTLNPMTQVTYSGVVMNRGSVWLGWGPDPEFVAKIGVGVNAVLYSDGSTWLAPS